MVWEKQIVNNNRTIYINRNKKVGNKRIVGLGVQKNQNAGFEHRYSVDVMGTGGKLISIKYFKTKNQALKYAREYMKKH